MNATPITTRANPWAVLAVFGLGLFLTLLDLTIVNIAIPSIVGDLRASLDEILWMLNAYSLVYAVLLITSGRLGDILGPRTLFVMGVATFTAASAVSGFAQDPLQLILARGAQGLGAALLAPQGLPMITRLFPPEKRGGVFAIYGILGGLAVVLGPTLGGLIVTNFGWRWIFYVNIPVGLAVVALTVRVVPDLRPGRPHRLDLAGVALASTGLLAVVFGLIEGQRYEWGTVIAFVTIPMIVVAGVLLLALFIVQQARRQGREPLLPFGVFGDRNFALMAFVLATMGFAMLGVFLPITIYYQSVLGFDALTAGVTIAPMPLAMMLVSGPIAGLVQRGAAKRILIGGLALFVIGMAYVALRASADGDRWALLPGLVVAGIGMGGTWMPIYDLATRTLDPRLAGGASGVLSTIQELGAVLATAVVGAVLQNRLAIALHDEAVADAPRLPEAVRAPFVDGFSDASKRGFEVGAGQVTHAVFGHAFVDAMRPAMAMPLVLLLLAALLVAVAAKQRKTVTSHERMEAVA